MPHKDKEARRVYEQANKERRATVKRVWSEANKERIAANNRAWREANKEKLQAREKARDPIEQRARYRRYRAANKEKLRAAERAHAAKPEVKARAAELARKRREADPVYIRSRDNAKHQKNREALAGRRKPEQCEICAATHRKIMWDHCHQKGHFRGWVCQPCNIIMGMACDSPQHLLKVIAYLERNRENTAPQLALAGI